MNISHVLMDFSLLKHWNFSEMGRYVLYQSFAKIYVDSEYNPPNQIGTRKDYWQNEW